MGSSWARSFGCTAQRHGVVLVWLPVFALFPVLALADGGWEVGAQVLVVAAMVATTLTAVLLDPARRRTRYAALAGLAAAVVAGSTWGDGWLVPWGLLAIAAPAVLRGWSLAVMVLLTAAGSMVAGRLHGAEGATSWISGGGTLLAAVTTTSFLRLMETIGELRRTREELARVAVAEERERFSRDLHDLLGHTLSVMVVKAEAVRRLAHRDPDGAAAHAADIERVGREALVEVRHAVDGMRSPSLVDSLEGARRALEAAGIRTTVAAYDGPVPAASEQALAWVVREGATNVLRHSGAGECRIEVGAGDGRLRVVVADDGVGGPRTPGRRGGLEGLRQRMAAVDGELAAEPGPDGFRLTAAVPLVPR